MKLLGVDGWRLTLERLRDRVAASKAGDAKMTLLLEDGDQYHSAVLVYSGGPQYPILERIHGEKDVLADILRAKRDSN